MAMDEEALFGEGFVPVPVGSGWYGYSNLPESIARYGLTLDDYYEMLDAQDGKCAVCDRDPSCVGPLVVDHDHASGKVRALTCQHCNLGMGHFYDNPEFLWRAAEYLRRQGSWATRGEEPPAGWLWNGSIPGAE
jgi:Recombination endonuclease VII